MQSPVSGAPQVSPNVGNKTQLHYIAQSSQGMDMSVMGMAAAAHYQVNSGSNQNALGYTEGPVHLTTVEHATLQQNYPGIEYAQNGVYFQGDYKPTISYYQPGEYKPIVQAFAPNQFAHGQPQIQYMTPIVDNENRPVATPTRASPITIQWLLENYETAEGVSLPRSTMYCHYLRHCQEQKLDPMNPASFGKLIRSVFLGLRTRRLGTRGNSKYHYYGIRIKPTSPLNHYTDELLMNAYRYQYPSRPGRSGFGSGKSSGKSDSKGSQGVEGGTESDGGSKSAADDAADDGTTLPEVKSNDKGDADLPGDSAAMPSRSSTGAASNDVPNQDDLEFRSDKRKVEGEKP